MNKKILFIQPTIYDDKGKLVKKRKQYFVGLAHPLLSALLPEGWTSELCVELTENIPYDTDADVIGLGGVGHAARRAKDIAIEFKKRGKIVFMGGPMVSLIPELAKEYCDAVMIGDSEETIKELCLDIERGEIKPFYEKPLTALSIPLPRYELMLKKRIGDFLPVQAGRGCPNTCSFCTISCLFKGRYIRRDIDEVVRDIEYIKSLGFKKFLLVDDNIVSDPAYMLELCRRIKPLKMKWMSQCAIQIADNPELLKAVAESGCYVLSFGLESINIDALKGVNKTWCDPSDYPRILKTMNDAGIEIASEMIVGLDTDTPESLKSTAEFVEKSSIIAPKFYCLTPIPGTPLNKQMHAAGRIVDDNVFEYKPSKSVLNTPNMTADQVTEEYWKLYERLYSMRNILKRTIFNKRMLKRPGQTLFFFGVNMIYRAHIKRRVAPNIL
ncbi:MAG: B12-binding domain-containing radical SAM protein [Clostridiales bacterium]|nr:B12-binding domain-containing radical SAM protein [Clostridiales bacterium]